MLITSISNPKVQRLQKLIRKKKIRITEGVYIAEGVRLLEEAVKWGQIPEEVYWGESISGRGKELVKSLAESTDLVFQLTDQLVAKISDTGNSQGIFGVFRINPTISSHCRFLLVADQIRDPGNLGTLMRSAKAMGVDGVITTPGTVDAYSPKVVRSAMGVHFALPVAALTWDEINRLFPKGESGISFWVTVVSGGESILTLDSEFPVALVVGGEADGVSAEAIERSDIKVTIPMWGNTESLNAGVAGSIALYEIMRKATED